MHWILFAISALAIFNARGGNGLPEVAETILGFGAYFVYMLGVSIVGYALLDNKRTTATILGVIAGTLGLFFSVFLPLERDFQLDLPISSLIVLHFVVHVVFFPSVAREIVAMRENWSQAATAMRQRSRDNAGCLVFFLITIVCLPLVIGSLYALI